MLELDNEPVRIPYSYVHEHFTEIYTGLLPQPPNARYQCPCCGYYTFEGLPQSAVSDCPVCRWTFDIVTQCHNLLGANRVYLDEARRNFAAYGASEPARVLLTRRPRPDEMP